MKSLQVRRNMFYRMLILLPVLLSLFVSLPAAAQSANGLGVGQGQGLEVGINLPVFEAIRNDVANGLYDRVCTEAEHDPTVWHTLVNIEAGCHYDHQHGDDPYYVSDVFGEPGAWFQRPGQSISYPWQTFGIPDGSSRYSTPEEVGAQGRMENDLKHEGYFWVVRRDQPCDTANGLFCVKDFRVQFHGMMVGAGAATRWHSMSAEVRVCRDSNDLSSCGTIRTGGWMDFGRLYVQDPTQQGGRAACGHETNQLIRIPLAVDTQFRQLDPNLVDEERCHPLLTPELLQAGPSNTHAASSAQAEWWAHGASDFRFQLQVNDPLGNVYETSPGSGQLQNHLFCSVDDADCAWNQSIMGMRLDYIVPINTYFVQSHTQNNIANLALGARYIDRFGVFNDTCSQPGLDCVPIEYSNVILSVPIGTGLAGFTHTECRTCPRVDHDISPEGVQWITWFYKKFAGYNPPAPEPEPQPTPDGPALYFETNTISESEVQVGLSLLDVTNVYGVQVECSVNPAILQGGTLIQGEFSDSNSFIVDNGFQADGVWRVAASRLAPNPAISGSVVAMTMPFNVLATGDAQLSCSGLAVDANGNPLDLPVHNGTIINTPPINDQPDFPDDNSDVMIGSIAGLARFQNRPNNAGITVRLIDPMDMPITQLETGAEGSFSFADLSVGDYFLQFSAPQHIPVLQPVVVAEGSGQPVEIQLRAGDVDDNGAITIDDILLVAANFGLTTVPEISNVDLNADGLINISDLSLTAGNLDLVSPLNGQ